MSSFNWWQRVRVWLVALARSKLVKENEPEENPQDFPSTQNQQLAIHVLSLISLIIKGNN